jgi:hypothetical protein
VLVEVVVGRTADDGVVRVGGTVVGVGGRLVVEALALVGCEVAGADSELAELPHPATSSVPATTPRIFFIIESLRHYS